MYLPQDVNAITGEMIARLIENGVREGSLIEYKETLPGATIDEKQEFLKDVTAYANIAGGHLLYGIKAIDGVPIEVVGLKNAVPDKVEQRLEDLLKYSVEPRLTGVKMRYIDTAEDKGIFVIWVPRSWVKPHGVRSQRSEAYRFYERHGAVIATLNVEQIRVAFEQTGALLERVRRFRLERLALIEAGEGTRVLGRRDDEDQRLRALTLHIIPLAVYEDRAVIDPQVIRREPVLEELLRPLTGSRIPGFSFHGYFTYSNQRQDMSVDSYLQLFGNGAIENADATLMMLRNKWGRQEYCLPTPDLERRLAATLHNALKFYGRIQIPAPIVVLLTIIGADGYAIVGRGYHTDEDMKILERRMVFPEVILDSTDLSIEQVITALKPTFDQLWNAAGHEQCPFFEPSESGGWEPTARFVNGS